MAKLKISLKPSFKELEVFTKRVVNSGLLGSYLSVFKGQGLEFEDYKHYTTDDDASSIDWKASLRTNNILIKKFAEERELNIFLLIDVSATMFFGSTSKLKNEYAAELASSLCFAILRSGDSVGFALFSNKIKQESFPAKDERQFYLLLRSLTNQKNYGGTCNFKDAIEFTMARIKPNSIVMVISDFIDFGKGWEKLIKVAAGEFDLIGIMVRDPRDKTLPILKNRVLLEDPVSGKQLLVDTNQIAEKYRRYSARQEATIKDIFLKAGADFVSLSTDKDFSGPILSFFHNRLQRLA
ncbi:DUF58 domain-containing protein [Candidatus Woesearchaeota archaeon]|nr:DUF58 domain-containing protein [Candidatus Woesearchaeota archaeon]